MTDLVSSIQLSIEIVKKLRALNDKLKDADFKMLLADLQGELADAKLEVVALKEKMADLLTKNADLTAKLEARTSEQPEPMDGGYKHERETRHMERDGSNRTESGYTRVTRTARNTKGLQANHL